MLIAVKKTNLLWLFIILSGTLSFLIDRLASEISSSDVAVLQAEDKCLGLVIELIQSYSVSMILGLCRLTVETCARRLLADLHMIYEMIFQCALKG